MKTNKQKKDFKSIYSFVLGLIHSHPGLHAAHGPQVRNPARIFINEGMIFWELEKILERKI